MALGFGFVETDTMYRAGGRTDREPVWGAGEHLPFGDVRLSPAAAVFSYGVGVFEGLKLYRADDGRALLFRHRDNARRFQRSAERLSMPPFPVAQFTAAVEGLAARNLRFLPATGEGTFYIRPLQHAVEPRLGISGCGEFWVLMYGTPVGGYFSGDALRLKVLEQGRCASGGTGAAKAIGNYAGGVWVARPWKERGFDDVLYLDAHEVRYVTETSGANVFARLKNGELVTPALDDQILPGITRDSALTIAREMCGVAVVERPLPLSEILEDAVEVFCTGTAWTVRHVGEIDHRGQRFHFPERDLQCAIRDALLDIQHGRRADPFGWVSEVNP